MIGTSLNQYRITASIGAGGMGEVFRARDTRLNRDVAIKVLPKDFVSDADCRFTALGLSRSGQYLKKHSARNRGLPVDRMKMNIAPPRFSLLCVLVSLVGGHAEAPLRAADSPSTMLVEVDAREISRKLLDARLEIPVKPGKLALWYPKWVPGTHSPGGPVQNLAGLRLESSAGQPILWRRDETDAWRIECAIPAAVDHLVVKLDYICNQPSVNSSGLDSFGTVAVGFLNWNTCLLYPEGPTIDDLRVRGRLVLPEKWRFGTALTVASQSGGTVEFKTETLRDFVDYPVVLGEHFRTIDLKPKNFPPTFMHLAAESPNALQLDERVVSLYRNVATEAGAPCLRPSSATAAQAEHEPLSTCSDAPANTSSPL